MNKLFRMYSNMKEEYCLIDLSNTKLEEDDFVYESMKVKKFNIFIECCNFFYNKKKKKELIFIKNGKEIIIYDLILKKITKNKIRNQINNVVNINNIKSDFILLQDNKNIIRYKCLNDYYNNKDYKINKKIFLKLKLELDNLTFIINLNDPNYYILNNELFDIPFLEWYCKNKLNVDLNNYNNYNIIILDKNMNTYKIDCKINSIKLENDNFKIINKY